MRSVALIFVTLLGAWFLTGAAAPPGSSGAGVAASANGALPKAAAPPPSSDLDVAAFANGALPVQVSSQYGNGWEAIWLLDENPHTGWATAKDARAPFEIVIALPERSEIHALEFDTASVETPARSAKDIDVLVSDESATAGFNPLTSVTLKAADGQRFAVSKALAGRWLKLVVKSNNGDPDYTEIMDVKAFGRELTHTPLPNVSGTYSSTKYGKFHLSQKGNQVNGCYEYDDGLFQGGLESHLMRLTWTQGAKGEEHGTALMVMKPDGKSFRGFWRRDGHTKWVADWDLTKISDRIGSCPNWSPTGATSNIVASNLAEQGRVRLYGIHFDSGKATLRSDARPTLDDVAAALKAHPDWHITIEGHTDSTGTPARNLELSRRRAEAVKAALVAAGIAADRLATRGYGETRPIASNDTAIGRAQNRRVEIVRSP